MLAIYPFLNNPSSLDPLKEHLRQAKKRQNKKKQQKNNNKKKTS